MGDLSEDLPVDEGVAEVIGGLLSKVNPAPSHKFEAVVHLGLIIAWIVLQWPMRVDLYPPMGKNDFLWELEQEQMSIKKSYFLSFLFFIFI